LITFQQQNGKIVIFPDKNSLSQRDVFVLNGACLLLTGLTPGATTGNETNKEEEE
jgi:hypothetical protein